jgi:hypothetical protein
MATRKDKAGRVLTALAVVTAPFIGPNTDGLPLAAHAFDDSPKLPPMPGSLPYLWQRLRRWRPMSGTTDSKPPSTDPKRNIAGRIGVVLAAFSALLIHDAPDSGFGRVRPFGSDIPEPGEGWFMRWLEKANRWLQAKLDPPKKSN